MKPLNIDTHAYTHTLIHMWVYWIVLFNELSKRDPSEGLQIEERIQRIDSLYICHFSNLITIFLVDYNLSFDYDFTVHFFFS